MKLKDYFFKNCAFLLISSKGLKTTKFFDSENELYELEIYVLLQSFMNHLCYIIKKLCYVCKCIQPNYISGSKNTT